MTSPSNCNRFSRFYCPLETQVGSAAVSSAQFTTASHREAFCLRSPLTGHTFFAQYLRNAGRYTFIPRTPSSRAPRGLGTGGSRPREAPRSSRPQLPRRSPQEHGGKARRARAGFVPRDADALTMFVDFSVDLFDGCARVPARCVALAARREVCVAGVHCLKLP